MSRQRRPPEGRRLHRRGRLVAVGLDALEISAESGKSSAIQS